MGVPILKFPGHDIGKAVGASSAIAFLIGLPAAINHAATGLGRPACRRWAA